MNERKTVRFSSGFRHSVNRSIRKSVHSLVDEFVGRSVCLSDWCKVVHSTFLPLARTLVPDLVGKCEIHLMSLCQAFQNLSAMLKTTFLVSFQIKEQTELYVAQQKRAEEERQQILRQHQEVAQEKSQLEQSKLSVMHLIQGMHSP